MTIDGTYRPRRPAFSVGFPTGLRAQAGVLCGQEVGRLKSIFQKLYGGEIYPDQNVVPDTEEYYRDRQETG